MSDHRVTRTCLGFPVTEVMAFLCGLFSPLLLTSDLRMKLMTAVGGEADAICSLKCITLKQKVQKILQSGRLDSDYFYCSGMIRHGEFAKSGGLNFFFFFFPEKKKKQKGFCQNVPT